MSRIKKIEKEILKDFSQKEKEVLLIYQKVKNTGTVVSNWTDDLTALRYKEIQYKFGIKVEITNSDFRLTSEEHNVSLSIHNLRIGKDFYSAESICYDLGEMLQQDIEKNKFKPSIDLEKYNTKEKINIQQFEFDKSKSQYFYFRQYVSKTNIRTDKDVAIKDSVLALESPDDCAFPYILNGKEIIGASACSNYFLDKIKPLIDEKNDIKIYTDAQTTGVSNPSSRYSTNIIEINGKTLCSNDVIIINSKNEISIQNKNDFFKNYERVNCDMEITEIPEENIENIIQNEEITDKQNDIDDEYDSWEDDVE